MELEVGASNERNERIKFFTSVRAQLKTKSSTYRNNTIRGNVATHQKFILKEEEQRKTVYQFQHTRHLKAFKDKLGVGKVGSK